MVMEAIPSPDAVGREFVRQYYTLLNRAPTHAHRFYNSNSYFVHGAMSKPAIGQKQIHQKIQQLNFRDCHAKISQVDSQATLGNGLVVQVSGELSNDGEPMRRFTQTFVLGTHSPRMYYVHNDIFRYQDMLLSDEEGESQAREDDADQPQDVQQDGQNTGNIQYFNTSTSAPVETPLAPNQGTGQNVALNGTALHNENLQVGQTAHVPQQEAPAPVVNGRVAAGEMNIVNDDYMMASQTTVQPDMKSPKDKMNRTVPNKVEMEDAGPIEHEANKNENEGFTGEIQDMNNPAEVSNEPKTYATLLKMDRMGSGLTNTSTPAGINRSGPIYNAASGPGPRGDDNQQQSRPPRAPVRGGPARGTNRKERSSGPSRSSFNEDGGNVMGGNTAENQERRRNPVQYSDSHQLFMGNLPLDATEEDLRELFGKFGTIVDLRIHSKTNTGTKVPPGRVPNYGFITFENPQSVQEVLNNKPICFPRDGGIKLNVEEKKTKPRSSIPSQGAGGGGGGGGGGGTNSTGGGGNTGGSESSWSAARAPPRGGPSTRGSRGGGARGNFSRDSRGPPPNQRSNFTPRR